MIYNICIKESNNIDTVTSYDVHSFDEILAALAFAASAHFKIIVTNVNIEDNNEQN